MPVSHPAYDPLAPATPQDGYNIVYLRLGRSRCNTDRNSVNISCPVTTITMYESDGSDDDYRVDPDIAESWLVYTGNVSNATRRGSNAPVERKTSTGSPAAEQRGHRRNIPRANGPQPCRHAMKNNNRMPSSSTATSFVQDALSSRADFSLSAPATVVDSRYQFPGARASPPQRTQSAASERPGRPTLAPWRDRVLSSLPVQSSQGSLRQYLMDSHLADSKYPNLGNAGPLQQDSQRSTAWTLEDVQRRPSSIQANVADARPLSRTRGPLLRSESTQGAMRTVPEEDPPTTSGMHNKVDGDESVFKE